MGFDFVFVWLLCLFVGLLLCLFWGSLIALWFELLQGSMVELVLCGGFIDFGCWVVYVFCLGLD